jgi:tRNA(Ile2) C34 agmatinyltransferase TiaS
MTAALAPLVQYSPEALRERGGAVRRLEHAITRVWQQLASRVDVECPVCGGRMEPRYGAGARPIGGRCADCGSSLS